MALKKRTYPEKGFSKSQKFFWNGGRNYAVIPVEELIWTRISANNGKDHSIEGNPCSLIRIHSFKNVLPDYGSDGKIVSYSDPGFAPYPDFTLGNPELSSMYEDCSLSIYGKIKFFKNNVNAGNFLGERKRTIEMVSHRLGQLYQLLKKARKPLQLLEAKAARYPRNLNIARELANKRLEYSYGWAPLMSDIHGACNAMPPPGDISVQSTRFTSHLYEADDGFRTTRMSGTYKVTVKARLNLDMPFVASASSLGLDNPLEVAWELTPWSFVIDWFVPVGAYLENLTALNGYEVITAGATLGIQGVGDLKHKINRSNSTTVYRAQNRITYDFPNPFPPLKNPFSISHTLNALALIAQLRTKQTKHYEYTE